MSETLFTDDEIDDLSKAREVRKQVITTLTKDGMPVDKDDVTLILSATNDLEKSAMSKAAFRHKQNQDEKTDELGSAMVELLRTVRPVHYQVQGASNPNKNLALPDSLDTDQVTGETRVGVDDELIDEFSDIID